MLDEHIWLVSGTLIHRSQRCRITSSPLFWRVMSFLSGVSGAAWVRERPGLPHNGSSEEALWHWHQQPTEESGNVRRTFVKPFQMFTPHLDLILELHLPWFIIWITNGLIFFFNALTPVICNAWCYPHWDEIVLCKTCTGAIWGSSKSAPDSL